MSSCPRNWSRKTVLLVDDHPIVREGLRDLLEASGELSVVGEAGDARTAIALAGQLKPALAIVDLSLGNDSGLELIKSIREYHENVKVLVLSLHAEELYVERALRAGACGYVCKSEPPEVLVRAARQAITEGVYVSEQHARRMLARIVSPVRRGCGDLANLTDRELEVFELVGKGYSGRQIAQRLHRSVKTVESHCARIRRKLMVQDSRGLLQKAIQWMSMQRSLSPLQTDKP